MSASSFDKESQTDRFARMRERVIDAASAAINELGVKGMTLADVAQRVDLNTTSVTYYFKRKELLAEAAFERTMDQMEATVREAGRAPDPRARVSAYLRLILEEWGRIRRREVTPTARLSDLRAMQEPIRARLIERWTVLFREIRETLFGPAVTADEKALRTARVAMLLENVFWLPAWLNSYSALDFPRVHKRLFEVFDHGLAIDGARWAPQTLELAWTKGDPSPPEAFLRAATRLINERGYRGVSVERIASDLQVTKGSFYHHLETKDDLVVECFERSYDRVSRVQTAAIDQGDDAWTRLSSAIAALTALQFEGDFPLLRTTALQALPADVRRHRVIERSNRMAQRFAGMMIDGISEGTIRPIDPMIASQVLMSTLNNAYELRHWAERQSPGEAARLYASTVAFGLFEDPPG
jgi:AcrR family transcriptional regulator